MLKYPQLTWNLLAFTNKIHQKNIHFLQTAKNNFPKKHFHTAIILFHYCWNLFQKKYIWLENHVKCLWLKTPIYSTITQYKGQKDSKIELEMSLKSSLGMIWTLLPWIIWKQMFLKSFSHDTYTNKMVKTGNWWGIKRKFLCDGSLFIDFFFASDKIVSKSIFLAIVSELNIWMNSINL